MTQQKIFKRGVRARMQKTGESYAIARALLLRNSRQSVRGGKEERTTLAQMELTSPDGKTIHGVGQSTEGTTHRLTLATSQLAFVEWFHGQFSLHKKGETPRKAILVGDRRGGKTWAGVMCMVSAALDQPGARTYVVSGPEERHEIRQIIEAFLPSSWVKVTAAASPTYVFTNGSQMINVSSRVLGKLKIDGLCLFVNDYSKLKETQVDALLDAIPLSIVAGNAPDQDRDEWFSKYRSRLTERTMDGFRIRPEDNPFINQEAYQKYSRFSAIVRPPTATADDRFWTDLSDEDGFSTTKELSMNVIHAVQLEHAGTYMPDGKPISRPTDQSLCGAPMPSMLSGALAPTSVTCKTCKELLGIGKDRGSEAASPKYEQFLEDVLAASLQHTAALVNAGLPLLEMQGRPAEIMASAVQLSEDQVAGVNEGHGSGQSMAAEFVREWFATMPHWLDPDVAWKSAPLSHHRCFLVIVRTAALAVARLRMRMNAMEAESFVQERLSAAKRLVPSYETFAGHDDAFMAATDFVEHWPKPGIDAPSWLLRALKLQKN